MSRHFANRESGAMLLPALKLKGTQPQAVGTKSGLRPDIQGLRAIAVGVVILDHLFGWPSGGFVGVDVFFVISGFLITGLLIREWDRNGRISFRGFYRRRIKRILPASVLVIGVTVVVSKLLFSKARFASTLWDGFWSLLFSANWRFMAVGSDYFQADGPISPLRHFWSLAVEEQFYFVWPWIMLAVLLWWSRKSRRSTEGHSIAAYLIIVISLASFGWALFESSTNPGAAYYSSFTRAWELGFGAILAFGLKRFQAIPDRVRPWLANLGLIGIVASCFVVSSSSLFPAPGALLPVLSAGLVIVSGSQGDHRFIPVLTNSVSRYLGDISYSLYLWHFPVIIFLGTFLPSTFWPYYPLALFIMVGLSAFSYRLVEDPIRKSSWLSSAKGRPRDLPRKNSRTLWRALVGLLSFGVAAALLVALAVVSVPAPTMQPGSVPAGANAAPISGPAVQKIQNELAEAVKATSYPPLNPTMEDTIATDPYPDGLHECGNPGDKSADECTFGPKDATKHAVLVGDSISMRWAIPMLKIYTQNGWNIRTMGRYGCPFNDYPIAKPAEEGAQCTERKAQDIKVINDTKPDLLIIGNTMVPEQMSTTGKPATVQDWEDGMESILGKAAAAKKFVVLSPPPFSKDVRECYGPLKSPQDCLGTVSTLWYDISAADKKATEKFHGVYMDTRALVCAPDNLCPAFSAGMPVKKDYTHLSMAYTYHIQDALAEMLRAGGVLE
ncbi:acyltransferase family protein [Psychromicrobium xiongbiense]|uniref:acyltransferase family protein n=1 Tax=Psychromicrobium xiongbiense TaxID=3051184 RepID=UPI002555E983|nr:acyltransferase family protein [Psychromicrobium sp. YIM S02556]